MKTFLVITITALTGVLTIKCDPERNPNGAYYASLKGQINKTAESIVLGDTLKLTLQWPDVLGTVTPLGDTRSDAVSSLQYAWFAYRVYRIDTVNRTVYPKENTKTKEFLSEGSEVVCTQCYGFTPYFKNDTKPLRCVLNVLPQTQGIFYLEIIPQAGSFKINNQFEGLFKVDFDLSNKHANLVAPYIPNWEAAVEERSQKGFGVYCFRVI